MEGHMLFCVLVLIVSTLVLHTLPCFAGQDLIVGGNGGWRSSSGMNYQEWANSNTYHPGDTLVFMGAHVQVVELNQHDYTTCNMVQAKYQNFNNENTNDKTIIKLIEHGIHYFSSNIQDQCKHGMKFKIIVQPLHDSINLSKFPLNFPPMDDPPTDIMYPPPPLEETYSPPNVNESPSNYPPPNYPNPTNPSITSNQNPLSTLYPSNNPYNNYNGNNNNMATSTISSFNVTLMVIMGSILYGFVLMHFL